MKAFNNKNINDEICNVHNKKYESYCSDCKKHLCKECLKSKEHIVHIKYNLIEFHHNENDLKEIQNNIKYYENKIENLENEKLNKTKELNNKLKEAKEKLQNEIDNINKENDENINNKYKTEIDNLDNDYIKEIQKLDFNKKIENTSYLKRLNEIIYNTYNMHNNNYFNSINVNNLLTHKEKNKIDINKGDKIIKKKKALKKMNLNKENKININKILENKKQSFIIPLMLSHLVEKRKLETVKYNKRIQSLININLVDYKLLCKRYIIFTKKGEGKEYNYENSELVFEGEYLNGKRNGKGKEYENGNLMFEGEYLKGKKYKGIDKEYNSKG